MADKKHLIYKEDLLDLFTVQAPSMSYNKMFMAAANAPTVDAVEVVHGRWIAVPSSDMMTGKAYKCSECNTMRYGSFMPNYCSHCGAKMDGETHEQ